MTKSAQIISSLSAGGAENLVKNLAITADMPQNIEVWSVGIGRNKEYEEEFIRRLSEKGVRVVKFNKRRGRDHIKTILKIRKYIRINNIHILNAHSELAAVYCLMSAFFLNVIIIQTVHNIILRHRFIQKHFVKLFLNHWVAVSWKIRDQIIMNLGVNPQQVSVIHNGIKTERFSFPFRRHESVNRIINIARLEPQKDHLNLLRGYELFLRKLDPFEKVPELLIIGEGTMKKIIELAVLKKGLQGYVKLVDNTSEVEKHLREADLFVLSSEYEGLPMVILEAMASGLTVISTDTGGVGEMIDNYENGLLVPKQNPVKLSEAILYLFRNNELRLLFSTNGIKKADQFSIGQCTKHYKHLYSRLSSGSFIKNR